MDTNQHQHERTIAPVNETNPHLALQRKLMAEGLLYEIRLEQHFDSFEPLPGKGTPASEKLIKERR